MDRALDQVIDDDELRLIFTACHPALAVEGRVALTSRLIGGFTTAEIARAFLVPEKTMGQRIFRAKKTLSDAHVPFETPRGNDMASSASSPAVGPCAIPTATARSPATLRWLAIICFTVFAETC